MTQSSHHSLLSRLSLFALSGCIALQGQAWAMGRIDIASQKNLGLESVRLESGGDLTLYAKDDLILSPGFQVREQDSTGALSPPYAALFERNTEPGASRRVTERVVIQNHLQSGGDLNVIAGGNLALIAVEGKAGQDLNLNAGGVLAITGADNESVRYERWKPMTVTANGVRRNTGYQDSEAFTRIYVGSQFDGRNLNLASGSDALIQGSQFRLTGKADIISGGNLLMTAAEQRHTGGITSLERILDWKTLQAIPQESATLAMSRIEAGEAVTLQAAGDLDLAGSRVATPGRIEGKAGGDLRLISLQDSVTPMPTQLWNNNRPLDPADQALQSTRVTAELAGGQGIWLDAGQNLVLQGAALQSGKDLSLAAGKDLQLLPLALENRQNAQNFSVTQAVTEINAQDDISLKANEDLLALGGRIKSETGDVTLNAGKNLVLASVLDQSQSYDTKNSGGMFKSTTKTTVAAHETVKGVNIETGNAGKLSLKSGNDMALESINLKSGAGGLEIESGGNLSFGMADESHYLATSKEKSWVVWQKNQLKGQSLLTGIENQLQSEGPIQIKVANGLSIEYVQRKGETAEAALERVSGTPWLLALGQEREIDWQPRADGQQNWSKSHQGLSPMGAAVVAFVVAYYSDPYTGQAVGGALAAAEITVSAATQTALTAAATAAVANIAVQLGTNGKVDGKQVFQSALLAGLTVGISEAKIWGEGNQSLNQLAGIKTNGVLSTADKGFLSNLSGEQMLALGGRSVIGATLNKVIFGTDFKDGFKSSLTSDLSALFAKDIGWYWGNNGQSPNAGLQTLAHMGLGAASAKVTGQDPAAGAIGGLVESALGNILTHNGVEINPENRMDYILYTSGSMLAAGMTAQLLGKDSQEVATAANVAKNAAENNFLTAPRFMDKAKELEACKANSECSEKEILSRYQQEWDRNVAEFEKNPSLMKGYALQEIRAALVVLLGQGCDALSACPSPIQISNSITELDELIYRELDPYGYKLDKLRDGLILDAVLLGGPSAVSLINKILGLFRAAEVATVTTGVVTQTANIAKGGVGATNPGKLIGSIDNLTIAERAFVNEMVAGGKTVEIIPTAAGRTADFLIDGTKVELKTLSGVVNQTSDGLSSALSSRIMDARGQSGNIIIDARGQAGMTTEIAERGIGRAFGADKDGNIQSISVITQQGTLYIPRIP